MVELIRTISEIHICSVRNEAFLVVQDNQNPSWTINSYQGVVRVDNQLLESFFFQIISNQGHTMSVIVRVDNDLFTMSSFNLSSM